VTYKFCSTLFGVSILSRSKMWMVEWYLNLLHSISKFGCFTFKPKYYFSCPYICVNNNNLYDDVLLFI